MIFLQWTLMLATFAVGAVLFLAFFLLSHFYFLFLKHPLRLIVVVVHGVLYGDKIDACCNSLFTLCNSYFRNLHG